MMALSKHRCRTAVAVEKFVTLAVSCRPQAHLFGILKV